jgi:large subunit ribosomal protein L15
MELNDLITTPGSTHPTKRLGRGPGTGHGKTSGKGHKGHKARSGHKFRRNFEGGQMPMHMRLPKRGFNHAKRRPLAIINVEMLEKHFESGAEVTVDVLLQRHLVADKAGGVKVLGKGEITKALKLAVHAISPGAQQKIEAAGGSVVVLGLQGTGASDSAYAGEPTGIAAAEETPAADATEE